MPCFSLAVISAFGRRHEAWDLPVDADGGSALHRHYGVTRYLSSLHYDAAQIRPEPGIAVYAPPRPKPGRGPHNGLASWRFHCCHKSLSSFTLSGRSAARFRVSPISSERL